MYSAESFEAKDLMRPDAEVMMQFLTEKRGLEIPIEALSSELIENLAPYDISSPSRMRQDGTTESVLKVGDIVPHPNVPTYGKQGQIPLEIMSQFAAECSANKKLQREFAAWQLEKFRSKLNMKRFINVDEFRQEFLPILRNIYEKATLQWTHYKPEATSESERMTNAKRERCLDSLEYGWNDLVIDKKFDENGYLRKNEINQLDITLWDLKPVFDLG